MQISFTTNPQIPTTQSSTTSSKRLAIQSTAKVESTQQTSPLSPPFGAKTPTDVVFPEIACETLDQKSTARHQADHPPRPQSCISTIQEERARENAQVGCQHVTALDRHWHAEQRQLFPNQHAKNPAPDPSLSRRIKHVY